MARKEIKAIFNDNELNKMNSNFKELYDEFGNVVDKVSNKAYAQIVDSAKLNWKEPVDSVGKLPANAFVGDTRMTRDTGKVYRNDGSTWHEIQQIDAGPVNEVDSRLTSQLANNEDEFFKASLVNHKSPRFKVWWIDDDGHKGVYTKIAPWLREYGIKMSAAIITDRPHGFPIQGLPAYDPNSNFMSYAQMKELEKEGIVEFIPHTHTHDIDHRLTDMTVEEMRVELSTCKNIMRSLGWNYNDLVYPFGAQNSLVRSIARQYYRSAINISGGATIPPINQFAMPRIGMDSRTAQEIIDEVDKAYENDTLIILMSHVDQYGGLEESKMRMVIEHVLSLGGEFVSADEAINNFGNLLQLGEDDSISFDGQMHGRNIGVYRNGHIDFDPNADIAKFQRGTVNRLKIRQFDAEEVNLPPFVLDEAAYGFIEIHRDTTEDFFSFRRFISVSTGRDLVSKWDNNEGWLDWEILSGEIILPSNSKDGSEEPGEFPQGVVSVVFISDQNSSGTPDNLGGTLKTYRLTSDDSGVYQEFKLTGSGYNKYTRSWLSTSRRWTDWEQDGFRTYVLPDTFSADSPISDYPERRETVLFIRDNNAEGFPENIGGILTTYRLSGNTYNYQEYKIRNANRKHMRTWSSSGWGDWEQM